MNKVNVIIYYWVLIIAALLATKFLGHAADNKVTILVIAVTTIFYAGLVFIYSLTLKAMEKTGMNPANGKAKNKKQNQKGKEKNNGTTKPGTKHTKKH